MKNRYLLFCISGLLLLAIFKLPYWYYQLLRIVVFGVSVYLSYQYSQNNLGKLTFAFGICALVFNPIMPIYLSKTAWIFVDIGGSILFATSGIRLKRFNEH